MNTEKPTTPDSLHVPTKPLRIGGVMRCCAHTLANTLVQEVEGETLQCKYTGDPLHMLIFRNGCWEWWHDRPNAERSDPPKETNQNHENI